MKKRGETFSHFLQNLNKIKWSPILLNRYCIWQGAVITYKYITKCILANCIFIWRCLLSHLGSVQKIKWRLERKLLLRWSLMSFSENDCIFEYSLSNLNGLLVYSFQNYDFLLLLSDNLYFFKICIEPRDILYIYVWFAVRWLHQVHQCIFHRRPRAQSTLVASYRSLTGSQWLVKVGGIFSPSVMMQKF